MTQKQHIQKEAMTCRTEGEPERNYVFSRNHPDSDFMAYTTAAETHSLQVVRKLIN